jgi:hypothetical protein
LDNGVCSSIVYSNPAPTADHLQASQLDDKRRDEARAENVQRAEEEKTPVVAYSPDETTGKYEGHDHAEHVRYDVDTRSLSSVVSNGLEKYRKIVYRSKG